jgi:catechol 2,3-dioxygenase-like lactoylglutathione lyase family enzyme
MSTIDHVTIRVDDLAAARAFYDRAFELLGDNGAPGERPQYHPGYYGGYVIDPAGTNLEAVFHNRP